MDSGLLYVAATLLPLGSFLIILLAGGLKNLGRTYRAQSWGNSLYWLFGGDQPGRGGAYLATGAIALSCVLSLVGLARFLNEHPVSANAEHAVACASWHQERGATRRNTPMLRRRGRLGWPRSPGAELKSNINDFTTATWPNSGTRPCGWNSGYYIDHLSAVMFAMVTFIATLAFTSSRSAIWARRRRRWSKTTKSTAKMGVITAAAVGTAGSSCTCRCFAFRC